MAPLNTNDMAIRRSSDDIPLYWENFLNQSSSGIVLGVKYQRGMSVYNNGTCDNNSVTKDSHRAVMDQKLGHSFGL